MPTVTFLPGGRTAEARVGAPLFGLIRGAGLPLGFACRGRGVCLACRVRVDGDLAPPGPAERALLARVPDPGPWRIACLARVTGDATVRADYW